VPSAPVLSFADATLAYPGAIGLSGLTLDIEAGQAVALVGPNGAGKSTLLKAVLGQVPATSGRLAVLGGTPAAALDRIGYMPQTDELDPEFPVTLRQVVMMGRYRSVGWLRWPGRADREAVDAALTRVGLTDLAGTRFGRLSGGQRQRGMLARALVSDPRLLLLDEPFNGLDQVNRDALLGTIAELTASGVAVVVSTHDLELVRAVCDRVVLLNGRMVAEGPVDATLTLPLLEQAFGSTAATVDGATVLSHPDHGHHPEHGHPAERGH